MHLNHNMITVCDHNLCAGCMACQQACEQGAITIVDDVAHFNAYIDSDKCVNCNRCRSICQQINVPKLNEPIIWKQGWTRDDDRKESSSGGVAAAIIKSFIDCGGFVCSCIFDKGDFIFKTTNNIDDYKLFRGSKYVKSNPTNAYKVINKLLLEKERVLFIGLPCQVAAIKNFISNELMGNLYTIDLICHGSPSVKLLRMALNDYGYNLDEIDEIAFRQKNHFNVLMKMDKNSPQCLHLVHKSMYDLYTLGFIKGMIYTENCYTCRYASKKRVGDLTLGDSWGTELVNEKKAGVSLVLIQTNKGQEIISNSNLCLYNVDIERAVMNNEQLVHASVLPKNRSKCFDSIVKTKKYNRAIKKYMRMEVYKQYIKRALYFFRERQ